MGVTTKAFVSGLGKRLISVCCDGFAHALQSGTDSEGYSSLTWIDHALNWRFCSSLPDPCYCPWCGERTVIKIVSEGNP